MNELARSVLGVLILRLSLPLDGLTAGPQKAPRSPRTGERRLMKARGQGMGKGARRGVAVRRSGHGRYKGREVKS